MADGGGDGDGSGDGDGVRAAVVESTDPVVARPDPTAAWRLATCRRPASRLVLGRHWW